MIQLFFNTFHFDQEWAIQEMGSLLNAESRVTILPILSDEGWASDEFYYRSDIVEDEEAVYDYVRPFRTFGIPREQIRILSFYDVEPTSLRKILEVTDVLVLVANDAGAAMHVLEDYALDIALKSYQGIWIGVGAGALMMMDQFADNQGLLHDGLNLSSGFGLCMNYQEYRTQLKYIVDELELRSNAVVVCPDKGGFFKDDEHLELLGDTFIADREDLDDIYDLMSQVTDE